MVLCDAAHRDAATGKFTLLGTFSTFRAHAFPAKLGFAIYFAITDGIGPTDIRLRLVTAESLLQDEEEVVFEIVMSGMNLESPLMVAETVSAVACTVPQPGLYHCELYAGESLLMSRRLLVMETPKVGDADND